MEVTVIHERVEPGVLNEDDSVTVPHPDAPHPSGDDRYAIYSIDPAASEAYWDESRTRRLRVAETRAEHVIGTIETLRDEGELTNDSRIGVLDRATRRWIINPWAKGDPA